MTSHAENTVLVMGASSPAGIGAAIARRFAAAGHQVLVSARNAAGLQQVAAKTGAKAHACDITDQDSCDALFAWVAAQEKPLGTAIYATGLNHFTPLARFEPEAARACVETNFLGALGFCAGLQTSWWMAAPSFSFPR